MLEKKEIDAESDVPWEWVDVVDDMASAMPYMNALRLADEGHVLAAIMAACADD